MADRPSSRPRDRSSAASVALAQRRLLFAYLGALTGVLLAFAAAFVFVPGLRATLVAEDGPMENLTVLLFAAGALACAVVAGVRGVRRLPRGYLLLGGLCLFGILEEISYGQRFLDIAFPRLANGATFDAVSDLNRVMTIALDALDVPWQPVVAAVAVLAFVVWRRAAVRLIAEHLRPDSVWSYALAALAFVAFATLIDTHIAPPAKYVFLEEAGELAAALSLLFAALAGLVVPRRG